MGKIGLAVDLLEYTARFVKTCGKKSVLATKPQNLVKLNISGLKLVAPLKSDICTFTKDPTLAPELLEDLLMVKGTQTEKAMQIKDKFLRALGYKHPELVKEGNFIGNMDFSINFLDGTLSVTTKKEFTIRQLIPCIRHEVDHIDKFAKLVKSEGIEKTKNALIEDKFGKSFDHNFWLKMSEDADITNFDAKKYLDALRNYSFKTTMGAKDNTPYRHFCSYYKYCDNEFEKSAYQYQKKLLKYYGEDDIVMPDIAKERFGKIKKLIESYIEKNKSEPIPNFSGESTFDILSDISIGVSDPKGVKALKYIKETINGKIEPNQAKLIEQIKILQDINSKFTAKAQADYLDRIYQWLQEGKFTLNDFEFG